MAKKKSKFLQGRRIDPRPISSDISLADLVDESFLAYNAARLREACQLFSQKMLEPEVTVGLSITGALTPAGLGISALIPLIKAGFVDWIISTGANLYHDTHFGLGLSMHQGNAQASDILLREEEVVRIYDIFFDYSVLLDTDAFFRKIIEAEEFQRPMSTAEFHYLCGRYVHERERKLGIKNKSLLAAAYQYGVPIYTSSPGDSSIGMNVAAKALQGNLLAFDPSLDVNETAAIVLAAKRDAVHGKGDRGKAHAGRSAVFILGGGSPKNFMLQTEPQIQEVLGIDERGHDYFLQVTDARPDTGGLCVAEGTFIDAPRDLSLYPNGIPIEKLVGKSGFYVYSFDHEQKKITLSEVEKVWRSGEKEVWRLRYGWFSGQRKDKWQEDEILATPEHLVMLHNGSYKPLKALKIGESLKAFNTSYSIHGYRQISLGTGKTIPEHCYLLEFALGRKLKTNEVSHHLNHNFLNNNLDNLAAEDYRARVANHRKLEWQKKSAERTFDRRLKMFGVSREEIKARYVDNHKVISIEPTGIIIPVYDMRVKKTHNFVANGIVVHNSGATPGEAVSWGKVDPERLPDAVVCYVDSTVALPIITAYALARHEPREPKRLYERREEFMELLMSEYKKSKRR